MFELHAYQDQQRRMKLKPSGKASVDITTSHFQMKGLELLKHIALEKESFGHGRSLKVSPW